MAFTTESIYMHLQIPTPSEQGGPQWAIDVNQCFTTVDAHDHSPGYGQQITPAGLSINADLPMGNNNLTGTRTVRFQPQVSAPATAADLGCLYEVGVDLYYKDGSGNAVRITQGGSVAGASGTITGLPSGTASASYNAVTPAFVFQSATSTAAIIDGRSFILRNSAASSKGLTLSPPAAMSADYEITLPANPVSTKILTMTSLGVMSAAYTLDGSTIALSSNVIGVPAGGITATQLASDSVTTVKILDANVTTAKIADSSVTLAKLAAALAVFLLPTGAVIPYASATGGETPPTGFLLCGGQEASRTTYAALFAAIGTTYGSGDGSTTFNLPDLRGNVVLGRDNMNGTSANRVTFAVSGVDTTHVGAIGSTQSVTLALGNLPSHTHSITDPGHVHAMATDSTGANIYGNGANAGSSAAAPGGTTHNTSSASTGITATNAAGSGTAFSKIPPVLVMNYLIKT